MSASALIVEDDSIKAAAVVRVISNAGIPEPNISVVGTTSEARELLVSRKFDLLVIDVCLPVRRGAPPNKSAGVELLRTVYEEEEILRPKYIVGLTAYPDLAESHADDFENLVWSLVIFEHGASLWSDKLSRLASHIVEVARERIAAVSLVDICIISGLRLPEHKAVLSLPWNWEREPEPIDNKHFVYSGEVHLEGAVLRAKAAHAHRPGMVPTALLATKLITEFRPKLVLMPGICAGIKGQANIGDMLVATSAWDWQSGKLVEGGAAMQRAPEPDFIAASREILSRMELLEDQVLSDLANQWPARRPGNSPRLRFGPMACGSAVVSADMATSSIVAQHRKATGVDMESYGLYSAASLAGSQEPKFAVVKAVSDLADSDKSDEFQDYCAYLSAGAIHKFVSRFGVELCSR